MIQGASVFPSLTADEHLSLGTALARKRRSYTESDTDPSLLPRDLAASEDPAGLFSGGQRQALAVATMLASAPQLLLCDEPSAGLAPRLAREIIERLADLSRSRSLPVLWVEQRVADVLSIADRALFLRDGCVVAETDRPTEWLATDVLSELSIGQTQNAQEE